MNFNDLYNCVKKKFDEHQEIFLEIDFLAVNIEDIYGSAFYILWQNSKITVEPFYYEDHNVCIKAPQRSLELLFTERPTKKFGIAFYRKAVFIPVIYEQRNDCKGFF